MTDTDTYTHTTSVSNPAVPKTFLAEGHTPTTVIVFISVSQRVKLRSGHVSIDTGITVFGTEYSKHLPIFLYHVEIFCVGFCVISTEASLKINQVF